MLIPLAPVPKPRMTRADKWRKRPCVVRYRQWCDEIRAYVKAIPKSISVEFGVPMPKSWSQKKRDLMDGAPHEQKPDIDNMLKALLDACKVDDSHVHTVHAWKVWSVEGHIILNTEG